MVLWWLTASFRRKWQQVDDLELTLEPTHCEIPWSYSSSKSHWLVTTPERTTCDRWRNCRSTHQILEHAHSAATPRSRHWFPSLQLNVLEDNPRDREHTWLFTQSNHSMEVSQYAEGPDFDRTFLSRSLPINQSMRLEYRDRCWRWDATLLECFSFDQSRTSFLYSISDHPVKPWPQMNQRVFSLSESQQLSFKVGSFQILVM